MEENRSKEIQRRLQELQRETEKSFFKARPSFFESLDSGSITDKIDEEQRQKRIANDASEQDNKLKKLTLFILFGFLGVETTAVFVIAFFQGFKARGFSIDDWSFRTLVVSTILQITAMLQIAVQNLFPKK